MTVRGGTHTDTLTTPFGPVGDRTMVSHCDRGWCARTVDGEAIPCRSRNEAFDTALREAGYHSSRWGVLFEDGCALAAGGCPLVDATGSKRRAQLRLVVVR